MTGRRKRGDWRVTRCKMQKCVQLHIHKRRRRDETTRVRGDEASEFVRRDEQREREREREKRRKV